MQKKIIAIELKCSVEEAVSILGTLSMLREMGPSHKSLLEKFIKLHIKEKCGCNMFILHTETMYHIYVNN